MKTNVLKIGAVKYILGAIIGFILLSGENVFAFTVTVTTSPVGQTQICQNNVLSLKATPGGGAVFPIKTYTWTWDGVPASILTGVAGNAFFAPDNTTTPGSYTITCTVKDFLNNISSGTITIEVKESPVATISALGPTTFCDGGSVDLSAFSDVGYEFQWRKDFDDIIGATSSTYNVTTSGEYDVVVTNSNSCENYSASIIVTVNALPAATAGSNSPVCYNGAINLTSTPNGMVSYSWSSTAVTPFSSSNQNPIITNATPNNSGDYTVTLTDINACVNTATTTVFVYNDINGGTIGTDQFICYNGDPNAFTDIASPTGGDASWSYSWESFSGGGPWTSIVGANALTYDVPAGLTQTTQYRRVATNGCGVVNSNTITVTVYNAMDGGVIASDQALCSGGDPAAFTDNTSPSGGNGAWTYSWESFVGAGPWTAIPITNALTYDAPPGITQTTQYQRVSTNSCGTVNSNTVTVTITPTLLNNTITAPQTICSGVVPGLLVGSTPTGGSGVYTYQWQISTVGVGGPFSDILTATGKDYQPGALVSNTWYQRVAFSGSCTSISTPLAITVNPVIAGNTIAADQNVCPGVRPANIVGSTPTGGDATYAYQWQVSTVGIGGPYTNVAGATARDYRPPVLVANRWYQRVVTSGTCSSISNIVTITIFPDITNYSITAPQTICSGSIPAQLDGGLPGGGTGPFTYKWQVATVAAAGPFSDIVPAATGQNYQPGALIANRWYRRITYSGSCSRTSNVVAITVTPAIASNTILTPQTICSGSTPALLTGSLPTGGTGVYTYQWRISTVAVGGPYSDIVGATSQDYQPGALVLNTWYVRVVNSGLCTNTSAALAVTVTAVIANNTIAAPQTVCSGDTPALLTGTLPTGGTGAYTYQWQSSTVGAGGPFSDISGATSQDYQPGVLIQNTWYQRVVNSGPCSSISGTLAITVTPAIANNTILAPQTICTGSTPALLTGSLPTGGTGAYSYQWQSATAAVGGPYSDILGATGQDYQPGVLIQNTWYQRVVTSGVCSFTSTPIMITVNSVIANNTIAAPQTICFGSTPAQLTGSLPTGGSGVYTYQWQSATAGVGGPYSDVSGATGQNYQPGALTVNTWYQRIVTSGPCSLTSAAIAITITPSIANNTISAVQTICSGFTPALLTGSLPIGGSGVYTYQWQSATAVGGPYADILGATNQDYQPGILVQNTWYQRVVLSGPCTLTSNVIDITVTPVIGNNTISAAQSICYNSAPALLTGTSPTGGSGVYTYQWQESTAGAGGPFSDLIGETNPNYQPGLLTVNTWYQRIVTSGTCSDHTSNVIKITVGPVFTVTITPKSPKCVGTNDGEATANPVGGTPAPGGYTYSWDTSPVQTGQTATGLTAGIPYTVTVTDNIGCTATATVTLTDPAPIGKASLIVTPVLTCYNNSDGAIEVLANGGTPDYTYELYDGATLVNAISPVHPSTAKFNNLVGGSYRLEITDINSCPRYIEDIVVNRPAQLVINDVPTTPISCNGSSNGTITINASGGTGSYTYSVTGPLPGGTFQPGNVFNVGKGTYDIVVIDANNCEATWPTQIIMKDPPKISFNYLVTQITTCSTDNTGKIEILNASGGSGSGYEYSIYQPAVWGINPIFDNLPGGASNPYYVRVRDSNGCILTANNGSPIIIDAPDPITFDVVNRVNITGCWYNNNGSFRVQNALGGTGDLKVSINGTDWFSIPRNFTLLGIGDYTVRVRDDNNCEITQVVSLTGPTPITLDAPPTVVGLSCNSVIPTDGAITVTASGGAVGPLTYSIDGGAPQAIGNFTGLSAGDHTIRITDILGCYLDVAVNVPEPPAIVFTTEQKTDITCFGLPADGTITLLANGGTGDLTYTLSTLNPLNPNNGATLTPGAGLPAIFPGLMADSYSYVVTDSKGCNSLPPRNLSIDEPAVISITKQIPTDINCSGGTGTFSVDAIGGTNPLVYNLYDNTHTLVTSNGDGEFTIAVDGTYTVEVTDPNSCGPQIAGPFTFTQPTPIVTSTPVISQMTAPVANDGKIKLSATGGTPDYTFTLNTGPVLNAASGVDVEFTGLSAGVYSIVVTDSKGCTKTVSDLRIGLLDLTLTPTHITCNGLDNGQIVLTINGVQNPPYTTLWDNNGVPLPGYNDLLTIGPPLGPGNYTVNVVDASGVTGKASVTITEPTLFSATYLSTQDKLCFSDVNGSVTFTISGGTPPYTIAWTESGTPKSSIGNIATDVSPGKYAFTITDASSCGAITIPDITLANPAKLNISNIVKTDPNCNGELNGSITVTASGGTGTLGYSITGPINDNNTTGIFSNLPAGNYTVALTDANGCVASSDVLLTVTLTEPTPILVTALTPDQPLACPNIANGFVRLQVSGGTPDYTYLWSNNQQTPDLIDIFSGDYSVLITDAHGCTLNKNITVAGPQMLEIADTLINGAKCSQLLESGDDSGRIEIVSTTGGTGSNFTYLWDFPVTTPATGKIIDKLSAGNYTVTITDENGCIYEHSIFVPSDPNYFMKAYAYKDTTLCGSSPLELVAIPQGGILARTYDYSWYEIPNTSGVPLSKNDTLKVKPTVNTKYYLEIRNDGGCFSNDTVNVVLYPKINLNIPMYISAVQQDSIVNILYGTRYNLDVVPANTEFSTKFKWEPAILFDPDTSWNSSIYIDKEIHDQIRSYEIIMKDPQTKSMKTFIRIKAMAVTEKGCKDSLRLYVKMVDNITFGNVFSPNGDMINDRWEVPKDYLFPDLDIEIFDRWGALVWSASGDKAAKGWDGRTNNGKDLPIGTYYYVVKYNIKTADSNWKPVTGSITIVR